MGGPVDSSRLLFRRRYKTEDGLKAAPTNTGTIRIRWALWEIAPITGKHAHPQISPQGGWIMRIKRFGVLATTLVFAALALGVAARAGDQHSGTWKMNPAKSMYNPGPPAKSVTLTIVSDENSFKVNAEGIGGDGNPTYVEYSAKFDGKDYTITGVPNGDTVSVKRIDSNTMESTIKGRRPGDDDGEIDGLQRREDADVGLQGQGRAGA
jgi:hypothetical protein